ncbi:ABC1 kinase family protein [Cognatiyoonia koreensis]|nr:AarF/ABC1/UbiB kinase family protein [Cognatiyoonia koreensis]
MSESRPLPVPASRIARLSRLGSLTAGVAGNMALGGMAELSKGKRPELRNLLMTPRNIGRIVDELSKMRGAAMKIGQLLSMDAGEFLPPALAEVMARLRNDAHIMPPAQLKSVLNTNWPAGWLSQFKKFNVRPIAAASIGQVHQATLKDGREMAIKVQYPGVARSIDSDVANVGALLRISGMIPKGFDIAPYLKAAREQLHEETDYLREGAFLAEFGQLLAENNAFTVPEHYADWSTPAILAMQFVNGIPIEDLQSAPQEQRNEVASNLITLLLEELFSFGVMQTDPNFANYGFDQKTGKIILLDFGATRRISCTIIDQYRALMTAGLDGDIDEVGRIAQQIGFFDDQCDPKHRSIIQNMIMTVFSAIRDDFDFSDTSLANQLQREGMVLAEEGFVPPTLPVDVLYLQRKFAGTFLLCNRLDARVDLQSMLLQVVLRTTN